MVNCGDWRTLRLAFKHILPISSTIVQQVNDTMQFLTPEKPTEGKTDRFYHDLTQDEMKECATRLGIRNIAQHKWFLHPRICAKEQWEAEGLPDADWKCGQKIEVFPTPQARRKFIKQRCKEFLVKYPESLEGGVVKGIFWEDEQLTWGDPVEVPRGKATREGGFYIQEGYGVIKAAKNRRKVYRQNSVASVMTGLDHEGEADSRSESRSGSPEAQDDVGPSKRRRTLDADIDLTDLAFYTAPSVAGIMEQERAKIKSANEAKVAAANHKFRTLKALTDKSAEVEAQKSKNREAIRMLEEQLDDKKKETAKAEAVDEQVLEQLRTEHEAAAKYFEEAETAATAAAEHKDKVLADLARKRERVRQVLEEPEAEPKSHTLC